jgi:hypothetical protein
MSHLQGTEELLRKHLSAQLSEELAFFHQHKGEWMGAHRGDFVLMGKQIFGGFYRTYSEALRAGTRMFGLVAPFLIEEIREEAE